MNPTSSTSSIASSSLVLLASLAGGANLAAQSPGTYLPPEVGLVDFGGLDVDGFGELAGRTVLIESFAHW